ncbi:hypothetical protein [Haloplasma contractile]|uniref:Membrane lipoprotein n=1 Tax=Haloplasma contractile SSD-17B TaxID=1033810 RepID=U2EE20_9MOLU|nr:hypothetical protein [Haloplasma contractile]ERJ13238.1 membrane lipoprotein [Haloplasma contractile SSD-17B]
MKRLLGTLILIISILFLSGCSDFNKETFLYYNGYNDTKKKYFDDYSLIYKNNKYDLSMIAVRSDEIVDSNNYPYINYIVKWNVNDVEGLNLSCGNYALYSGYHFWHEGGNKYYLISGEEIEDYCGDSTHFELSIPGTDVKENIKIYRGESDKLEWEHVTDVNEGNTIIYIKQNISLFIYISLIIILAVTLIFIYSLIYKQNMNNFVKGTRVRKLPELSKVMILLFGISCITIVILIGLYEEKINLYNNNFIYYEVKENSTYYLPKFKNNNYELLSSRGRQEVYLDKQNSDDITFIFVLVDDDKKYHLDAMSFVYPNAAEFDRCNIELKEKETDYNGLQIGYLVECFITDDGEERSIFVISLGDTKEVDSKKVLVDVNTEYTYYKNAKGYYGLQKVSLIE